ncbi:unnamed protein product [Chilo suppressalis]|uniref:Uncharacterized protein n=1 Tax=Chilo suppressalis TaxID=168631 RepID=A0ABN8LCU3_CHISP|nr:unnamed protein product [Chilo suppressalis]
MAQGARRALLAVLMVAAVIIPHFTAQPPSADKSIEKDRTNRQTAIKAGKQVATTPKWGFFGTIFHLILEQINDTKSAYNQITDQVNTQFVDDTVSARTRFFNSLFNELLHTRVVGRPSYSRSNIF